MSFVSYSFIFFKKCTSFTNYMHIIVNAFLQRFPSRLSKISPKSEHLLLDNQSKVSFSDVIGIFLRPLREKFFFYIIIQIYFTMPHSLHGFRPYKISNEIYFSIMTLRKYNYKMSNKSNKSIRYLRCELSPS